MLTPALICETIKAICGMLVEFMRFYQTPEGQRLVQQHLADRAAWDKFWKDAGDGITQFFQRKDLFQ